MCALIAWSALAESAPLWDKWRTIWPLLLPFATILPMLDLSRLKMTKKRKELFMETQLVCRISIIRFVPGSRLTAQLYLLCIIDAALLRYAHLFGPISQYRDEWIEVSELTFNSGEFSM